MQKTFVVDILKLVGLGRQMDFETSFASQHRYNTKSQVVQHYCSSHIIHFNLTQPIGLISQLKVITEILHKHVILLEINRVNELTTGVCAAMLMLSSCSIFDISLI